MSPAETRSLLRAATLLLVLSLVRLAWASRPATGPPAAAAPVHHLLEESERQVAEVRARSRPLDSRERLDPNRATEVELDRLPGVGPATARAWVHEREQHGPFGRAGELERVRGIGPATARRLEPLLDFGPPPPPPPLRPRAPASSAARHARPIDLNRAGEDELQALPGIGPALARRIVNARNRAPFRRPEDLLRVRGIGPATLAGLRDRVVVNR